jgi:hypothetical protein
MCHSSYRQRRQIHYHRSGDRPRLPCGRPATVVQVALSASVVEQPTERKDGLELGPIPVGAVPGIARIAAGAWIRGAAWGIGTTLRASRRLTEAAVSGESAAQLLDEVRDEVVGNLQRVLGVVERETPAEPIVGAAREIVPERKRERERAASLRERGAALLERAATVEETDDAIHPGFDRIVDQLAPDEARILKLLVNEGPQPIVYINKAAPLGIGAREVARRLSLIGREAGCQRPGMVAAYLDNLVRLGLVAIRRDPIGDEQAYQVVEAQPEVVEAMKSVSGPLFRGQSSRRSVHITDFGRAFCRVAFPPEHLSGGAEEAPTPPREVVPPEIDHDARVETDRD